MDRGYHIGVQTGRIDLSPDVDKLLSTDGDLAAGEVSLVRGVFGDAFGTFNLWTEEGLLLDGNFLSAAVTDAAVTALGLIGAIC